MQETLNIVELIENNPIAKISSAYNSKLLLKIQESFTGFEQQLFISNFYCYLNYDCIIDFVIDLDNVWRWLGFSQKIRAKEIIERNFTINVDYKTALSSEKAVCEVKQNGGQNKQTILMTIECFKSLCLKAGTKKAKKTKSK